MTVHNRSLWAEYLKQIGDVSVLTGLRYSNESFLDNHNIAPRLTVAWEFMDDTFLTLGANRYYASTMVGYAIKSMEPDYEYYKRTYNTGTGELGDWVLDKTKAPTDYQESKLDTPYSDEYTAALTIPTAINGTLRLKTVVRKNKDQFSRSERIYEADGKSYHYEMANEGSTDYIGYAIEWSGSHQNHFFNANVTWSETENNGQVDYFDELDPDDNIKEIYYKGKLISKNELSDIEGRQNFAAPVRASASWSTMWLNERLMTHAAVQYRGAYKDLGDTGENTPDGYDIYEEREREAFTSVDTNVKYTFLEQPDYSATVDFRIRNLFNKIPHTDTKSKKRYQMGRSYWVGLTFVM